MSRNMMCNCHKIIFYFVALECFCNVLATFRHEEALKASQKACLMLKKMALQLERDAAEKPSARRNRARETLVFCWLAIAIYAEGVEHE